ncbi:MAG TPA: response regulator transcription factor [Bacteroidales bacterium]|nr:response regulator transcription factor [Bacteroidales bacterium]
MSPISVCIVDDHTLFRNGLRLLLNASSEVQVIAEAENGREYLRMLEKTIPDVTLMDIEMPGMNGIETAAQAIKLIPHLRIITLSMYGEEEYYVKMIDAGAKGFILKNSDISEVLAAIRAVYEGGTYFSQDLLLNVVKNIRSGKLPATSDTHLSEREIEILQKICQGYSNQEIADQLNISKRTVDKHRSNLLEKTGSKNTANLVIYALKHKLVEF